MTRVSIVVASLLLGASQAVAADLPEYGRPYPLAVWTWAGPYLGVHVGGGLGQSRFTDSNGPAVYGGDVRTPTALGGAQVGFNFQPSRNLVLGVEADISAVGSNGTNTCLASSGYFLSANCRVRQNALGTVSRKLNECRSSGLFPFESSPARFSTLRACSWYFVASSFSRSDTDRYPPNSANSAHLLDIALSRAALAIASRWRFVRAIVVPIRAG
jgi:opacity protein-like surface antigen